MAIEKLLEELIDAVNANTAAHKAASGAAPARDRDEDKGESRRSSKDEDKGESRRGGAREGAGRKSSKDKDDDKGSSKGSKKVTLDDVRAAYGDFLGSEDDKGHDERREFVEAVLNELGIDMMKQIKDEDFGAALYWLEQKKKYPKDNVDFSDRGEGDGDRRSGGGKGRSLV